MVRFTLIAALATLFVHATTWEGMVNHWVHRYTRNWPAWLKKPVYDCPICMSIWWGLLFYAALCIEGSIHQVGNALLIISLFAAGGINTVLIYIISYFKDGFELTDASRADG